MTLRGSRLAATSGMRWIVAGAWAVELGLLSLWLARTPVVDLREQLRHWQFWVLETQFVLLAISSFLCLPALFRSLALRRRDYALPAAMSILTFVLILTITPQTSRIYFDELIYQSIGQNLSDLRLAQMCNDGNVEYGRLQCWRAEYNKEPYGYPYILSLAYRLAGVRESIAPAINAAAAALLVFVVFLITTGITGSAHAGGYAAVVAALIPDQWRWAHTAAAEPSAAFTCAFAVLAAVAFVRLRTTRALVWMIAAGVFAMNFRAECLLVGAVILVVMLLYAPREIARLRTCAGGLLALALSATYIAHLVAVRQEGWGASGPRFSPAYLSANFHVNGGFFWGDPRFPVIYSCLAIAGMLAWTSWRAVVAATTYFLCFWGIFLGFYAGSYNYGADDRFSLMAYPSIAILAGIGAWRLVAIVVRAGSLSPTWLCRALVGALCFQFLWYLPFVRTVGEEAWAARADVDFARQATRDLPPNSLVLTHNPGMFQLWGVSAAQASLAAGEGYANSALAARYAGGVYFHWNFWCDVADPIQQAFCTTILSRYPHALIRESRTRDYRYAIYRLDLSGVAGR